MDGEPPDMVLFEPLTPTSYLDRAAASHGDRLAVVDGNDRWTYAELHGRCTRLAGALATLGGTAPVAVLAPNTHVILEAHFAVPWSGRSLVTINTRLSADEVVYILDHCGASVLVYDPSYAELIDSAVAKLTHPLLTIRADDRYEELIASGSPLRTTPGNESPLLSINYTSGTTGRPKGVMYHHRGAYLQALAMVGHMGLSPRTVHLWTLPMFHCHGWCFPWAVTAAAGTHVCLPRMDAAEVWRLIRHEGVTHLNGAPTVLSMLAHAKDAGAGIGDGPRVRVATGGAPPSPALLRRMDQLGFDVTHLYGLTETYGPAMICDWRPEWDSLDHDEQSKVKARQGVGNMISHRVRVIGADGADIVADGIEVGEIALRGNNVMLGYLNDPEATAAAAPDGWFRTGDLGVIHPDGYVEIRDRRKDIIISGGENISSIEIEQAIADHPAVRDVAVIAIPDERWGEVPAGFVTLHGGRHVSERDIIEHVKSRLASFKAPKTVRFGDLPKTSTGKIQKFLLRRSAESRVDTAV
ncbi:AMP-binding protein (plasmid) [Rhodococcus sp. USK10]|uniref:AMP-binding protein n=1 Tax=Rhodococcus sp. USK10 TaxID=2789739 RepID=UPI001C5E170E|nr:AMP-binding protein [Rhodococcus sp. USK10]QYB00160.1 AMP-binding protein [Rhodococcus sp. USK10]